MRELLIFKFRTIVGIATTAPLIEALSGERQPLSARAARCAAAAAVRPAAGTKRSVCPARRRSPLADA